MQLARHYESFMHEPCSINWLFASFDYKSCLILLCDMCYSTGGGPCIHICRTKRVCPSFDRLLTTAMLNQLQRQVRPCLKAVDLQGDKVTIPTHYGDYLVNSKIIHFLQPLVLILSICTHSTCTFSSSILHKEIFSEDNVKQSSGWK